MPSPRVSPPPTASASRSTTHEKKPSRQRPGSACVGCRSKKLKCDGKRPRCGTCLMSGIECVPTTAQSQRGPKQGHLKAMQSRIDTLEQRLLEAQNAFIPDIQSMNFSLDEPFGISMDPLLDPSHVPWPSPRTSLPTDPISDAQNENTNTVQNEVSNPLANEITIPVQNKITNSAQTIGLADSLEPQANFVIPDLLRADLDQLYFERTHHFVPILNRRRYFSWARSPVKTESQVCLQYAMWTSAASLSSQLQHVRESLYRCTQKLLESLESEDDTFISIEHVQARILILIYDFMRMNHQRGWMSAGRCFRLIQLMRLHELDSPNSAVRQKIAPNAEDWVQQEEKRRAFWMAYSLDVFISVPGEWPLTLHEHIKSTCLPAPEEDFQSGNYVEMSCLPDAINSLDQSGLSPFTESIILATLFRQVIAHRQQSATNDIRSNNLQDFWNRHNQLVEMLKSRADALTHNYATSRQYSCPMLLFTSMLAQAIVIFLCNILESVHCETDESYNTVAAFRHRSLSAARGIFNLSRSIAPLSFLKVHPFTPLPLAICADFFNTHRYLDESTSPWVQEIYELLKDMSSVNNLAQECSALGTKTSNL